MNPSHVSQTCSVNLGEREFLTSGSGAKAPSSLLGISLKCKYKYQVNLYTNIFPRVKCLISRIASYTS